MTTATRKEFRGAPPAGIERPTPAVECPRMKILVAEGGGGVNSFEKVRALTPRVAEKREEAASGNVGAKRKGKEGAASGSTGGAGGMGGKAKAAVGKIAVRATAPRNKDVWVSLGTFVSDIREISSALDNPALILASTKGRTRRWRERGPFYQGRIRRRGNHQCALVEGVGGNRLAGGEDLLVVGGLACSEHRQGRRRPDGAVSLRKGVGFT